MFKKIPFEEAEMKVAFYRPGMFGRPDTPVRTTPVTPRQNYDALMYEKHPYWMPAAMDTAGVRTPWNDHMGRGGEPGLVDDLGIEWVFEPTAGGSIVHPEKPQLMEDVNEWKEKVHLPDPATWEWEPKEELDTRFPNVCTFTNGFAFERMISMMGFVPAAMALLDDEQTDAIKEMLQAFADFGCKCVDEYIAHYPELDVINIHDDWGSQQSTFFSEEIAREIFLPYFKQVVDHIHSKGRLATLHSCGHNDKRVQVFIDAGFDEWQPQLMNDIEWLYDNYGDKIVFAVWPKESAEEIDAMSEEEQRACARRFVERFNKPGKPSLLSLYASSAPAFLDEVYAYSRKIWAEQ